MVAISYSGISQTSIDKGCTCIPNANLRAAAKKIEQGKIDRAELILERRQKGILLERLSEKDSIITTMNEQRQLYDEQMSNYERMIINDSSVIGEQTLRMKDLSRQLKTQRWKTRLAVVLGIIATGTTLLIK